MNSITYGDLGVHGMIPRLRYLCRIVTCHSSNVTRDLDLVYYRRYNLLKCEQLHACAGYLPHSLTSLQNTFQSHCRGPFAATNRWRLSATGTDSHSLV